jgi:metacaspase-1
LRTGRSLCIGVDISASPGGLAEADACALADVAKRRGFCSSTLLLGAEATLARVHSQLCAAAAESHAGDLFLITFSGHGGRKPCAGGASRNGLRAVWGLFDGSLGDAEMHDALAAFRPGVRVLVISDSCNGGVPAKADDASLSRVAASVLVLSACGEDQFADAAGLPGHFTTALLRAWDGGERVAGYRRFYETIAADMPEYQQPAYYWVGVPDARFEAEAPFTV